ncbi:ribokinase [Anaerolineae bacterium]|nr:ribokinase [Anaerolineae bacterium]
MPDIVVVGSLNMDLVVQTAHLPARGETITGRDFVVIPGGKGANQAVAASKLGASIAMIGRVGTDDFGRSLCASLAQAGVNTARVHSDSVATTGVALISVEDGGQNTIVVVPGANARVTPADVDEAGEVIASAKALIAQLEIPLTTVVHALRVARAKQVLTVLNPAPAQVLDAEILELVDLLIPNETEASRMTGIQVNDWDSAERAARELNRLGAKTVVITLGALGALVCEQDRVWRVPAFPVRAIDATAAGDAFVAALTIARVQGRDWEIALREASAAGALTTTKLGAQPALPTRVELEQFLCGEKD